MSGRTSSATVIAGDYTYIFVNRSDTTWIDVIQFKTGDEASGAQKGKLVAGGKEVVAKDGPLAALQYHTGDNTKVHHIALYFIGAGIGDKGKNKTEINEAKLDNASESKTNPITGWRTGGADITFQRTVARQVDNSSILAASSRGTQLNVVFTEKDNPDDIRYQWYDGKQWSQSVFPLT